MHWLAESTGKPAGSSDLNNTACAVEAMPLHDTKCTSGSTRSSFDVHSVFCARCHNYALNGLLDRETGLDIFKVDPDYEQHEAEYKVTP